MVEVSIHDGISAILAKHFRRNESILALVRQMNDFEGLVNQFRPARSESPHTVITQKVYIWDVLDLSFEDVTFLNCRQQSGHPCTSLCHAEANQWCMSAIWDLATIGRSSEDRNSSIWCTTCETLGSRGLLHTIHSTVRSKWQCERRWE